MASAAIETPSWERASPRAGDRLCQRTLRPVAGAAIPWVPEWPEARREREFGGRPRATGLAAYAQIATMRRSAAVRTWRRGRARPSRKHGHQDLDIVFGTWSIDKRRAIAPACHCSGNRVTLPSRRPMRSPHTNASICGGLSARPDDTRSRTELEQ